MSAFATLELPEGLLHSLIGPLKDDVEAFSGEANKGEVLLKPQLVKMRQWDTLAEHVPSLLDSYNNSQQSEADEFIISSCEEWIQTFREGRSSSGVMKISNGTGGSYRPMLFKVQGGVAVTASRMQPGDNTPSMQTFLQDALTSFRSRYSAHDTVIEDDLYPIMNVDLGRPTSNDIPLGRVVSLVPFRRSQSDNDTVWTAFIETGACPAEVELDPFHGSNGKWTTTAKTGVWVTAVNRESEDTTTDGMVA